MSGPLDPETPVVRVVDPAPAAEPDTKDWTWVLRRRCPECGLAAASVAPEATAGRFRDAGAACAPVLGRAAVRDRPCSRTWSPLEYGAHVRDVLRTAQVRLRLLLEQDDPLFADGDQDAAALAGRYGELDPGAVAGEVREAAAAVAALLGGVEGPAWDRRGRRSNGPAFTVATLARYVLRDVVHHLHDVGAATDAGVAVSPGQR